MDAVRTDIIRRMSDMPPSLPRRLTSVAGGALSLVFLVGVALVVAGLGGRTALPDASSAPPIAIVGAGASSEPRDTDPTDPPVATPPPSTSPSADPTPAPTADATPTPEPTTRVTPEPPAPTPD